MERRWGRLERLPDPIRWLSDNGPPYTAVETWALGAQLRLVVDTTPASSLESNGMAEYFIKTRKRDDVYLARLENPEIVLQQLPAWFDDD